MKIATRFCCTWRPASITCSLELPLRFPHAPIYVTPLSTDTNVSFKWHVQEIALNIRVGGGLIQTLSIHLYDVYPQEYVLTICLQAKYSLFF
jgi:hypothetical protein